MFARPLCHVFARFVLARPGLPGIDGCVLSSITNLALSSAMVLQSHFKLRVVSEKFDGVPLVKRHQLVYSLLDEEFKAGLHALNITAKTPKEIEKAAARE